MARKTPTVNDTKLTWYDEYNEQDVFVCDIRKDWQHWQDWLNDENHKSIRFVAKDKTSCTLVREYRSFYGGDKKLVWIAHKRLGGKLHTKYIGIPESCTYEKISKAAFDLSQRRLPT